MTLAEERKEKIRNEALEWLTFFYEEYPSFKEFIFSEEYIPDNGWLDFKHQLYNSDHNAYAVNGSFRGVIVIDNFDWVIKFNLDTSADYCLEEVNVYEDAVREGLGHYFAPCMYGGTFYGRRFYLMAKAVAKEEEIIEEMSVNLYNNDKEYKEYSDENDYMTEDDMEVIINIFGTHYSHDEVFKLLDFCSFRNVYDIHEGNVGYLDLNPVIIDYASC